ncbi:hypothetical protein [Pontibacter sp. G13]|uniref:hypothetical protein n=1 Tax=Pontibacter sp. G13 TaxID=3074898 RepID=UPI00288C4F5C|nr:hypothetical protein [Pontibacter sp. G13]WNJ21171.1 hypothetical protein RJD25_11945 [Pontibacter sp. G13]
MKEQNREALKRALGQLPTYRPDDGLWTQLDQALDHQDPDSDLHPETLEQAIRTLPSYRAPHVVWERISKRLDPKPYRAVLMAAACVGLLALAQILPQLNTPILPSQISETESEQQIELPVGQSVSDLNLRGSLQALMPNCSQWQLETDIPDSIRAMAETHLSEDASPAQRAELLEALEVFCESGQ